MPDSPSGSALLHRAFTEVPDYGVAARGFIGGVTPLSSMRDLPSYDEAERSHSDSNATARLAHTSRQICRESSSRPHTPSA
jgi:hypothetical protein